MASALLKPCATTGCPELVDAGHCANHARTLEQRRGSASSRGYDRNWQDFIGRVKARMDWLGILVECGAVLPGGPVTADSACKSAGLHTWHSNGRELSLDHQPPLRPEERTNPRAVCNPTRVQFLCAECHNAKTRREMAGLK